MLKIYNKYDAYTLNLKVIILEKASLPREREHFLKE